MGTDLKESELLEPFRDAQNVCAVAKGAPSLTTQSLLSFEVQSSHVKINVNVIYLPTKHQRALGARSKVSVRSRSNWNLEMLVFFTLLKGAVFWGKNCH